MDAHPKHSPHVTRVAAQITVVWLHGDLDLTSLTELTRVLVDITAAEPTRVVIDMSAVTFVSAATLGFLVRVHQHVHPAGFDVTVHAPPLTAVRLLRLSGLDQLVHLAGLGPQRLVEVDDLTETDRLA